MNALARCVRLAAALLVFAAADAQAGGPLSICNDAGKTPLVYSPAAVSLNYDLGTLGSRMKALADTLVSNAVALWTNVGTATITIGRGADLPVDVTTANYLTYFNKFSDGLNPVIYDTDGSIIDDIFGLGNHLTVLGFAGSAYYGAPTCRYAEGQAVINGYPIPGVTDTTMSVVIAHEIGHLIGLDHTQLDNTQGLTSSFPSNYPLMYPIAYRDFVSLHEDDIAAVSALYPDATLNSVYGQISGTFVLADGVTPVLGANLWATETTTNKVYSIVSDYRTQNTGYFKLLLPVGTYNLRAEAIQSSFNDASSVGPYSEFSTDPSFQAPLYVGGVPMATVTLGNATPTSFVINPGCVATLTFRINGTGSVGGNCSGSVSSFALNVNKFGTGSGTVTSNPAGIACGATCSASYASGTSVSLTATPAAGSTFTGWSACSGTGTCAVTMNSAISVTANFTVTVTDSTPSTVPAGLTASAASASAINLNWTGSTDSGGSGLAGYKVERCTGSGCTSFAQIATTATTAYADSSLGASTTYSYRVRAYDNAGNNSGYSNTAAATTGAASASITRLVNIATRGLVLTGDNVMIGGLIIGGTSPKTVLIRAVGPSMASLGVFGVLANPMVQLYSGQTVIASNDDWGSAANAAAIQATGLAPGNPLESAILISLAPGAYTAIVSGNGGGTGVGMVEVFEIDHPELPLVNLAARGQVQTGDNVMIGGFIIEGDTAKTVLIRAVGLSMASLGVAGVLANPMLQLYSGQTVIASNDDWGSATNAAAIQATGLAPISPLESAILITLAPGAYTAIVTGSGGGTGVGMVEVFPQ